MTAEEILIAISDSDATLAFNKDTGKLRYAGPRGALTAELRAAIDANRREIITTLGYCPDCKEPLYIAREIEDYILGRCRTDLCRVEQLFMREAVKAARGKQQHSVDR